MSLINLETKEKEEEKEESRNHIDLPDLYNSSFTVKQPTLAWVKNGKRKTKEREKEILMR